jgi:hypothetical protein
MARKINGRRPLGPGNFVAKPLAVVAMVMVTFPEAVSDVGLKLHVEAVGRPLQLNVVVPAAVPMLMPITYWAAWPAVTVALAVLEMIDTTGVTDRLTVDVLFAELPSPPPETFEIRVLEDGALSATFNVTVTSG